MEIKYVCSFGGFCQTAIILKNNGLKLASYPFDWIFSDCNTIIDCIEDGFSKFLDKSYHINKPGKKSGHSLYNPDMWHHHNITNPDDYNYYVRCIDRFKKLLKYDEHKLFIMMFKNVNENCEETKKSIIDFNNKLLNYTSNYTLLCIFHVQHKETDFKFEKNGNIDFLKLYTKSASDGLYFQDHYDNIYLNNLIKEKYKFTLNPL